MKLTLCTYLLIEDKPVLTDSNTIDVIVSTDVHALITIHTKSVLDSLLNKNVIDKQLYDILRGAV